ncbi:MAG: sodium:solute symporter family protein [Spirosomataceae bacterium]
MLLLFILGYLSLNLLVGWWSSRLVHNTEDFVLAGRQLPLMLASMVTFATWFGSETMMGAPSEFINGGILGVIEEPFGAALCLILVGLFYARIFYRLNIITFCDFFRIRFGRSAEYLSAVMIIPSYFGWITAQLIAMSIVLKAVMGLDLLIGVSISALLVMIYTIMGGMWSVSITDFMHNILLILGLIVLIITLLVQVGGIEPVIAHTPEHFFRPIPQEITPLSTAEYIAAWITVGLGSIPGQDIFQRVMASKNERIAVRSSIIAGLMYISIAMLPLFIALIAKYLHPELMQGDQRMIIPNMVLRYTNPLIQVLFFGALISAILSTTSGAILAPATVIGENLIKPLFPKLRDKQLLLLIRVSVVAVTLICIWMASFRQNIYELVGESSAVSLVSLFVPLTLGLRWRRANLLGCLLSMLGGMAVWLYCYNAETEFPAILYGLLASFIGMLLGAWVGPQADVAQYQSIRNKLD